MPQNQEPTDRIEGQADLADGRGDFLIVDDHPLYRAGLKSALGPLMRDCEEAATLHDALDALQRRAFDLVLFDWRLPDGGGSRGLVAVRQLCPSTAVVVISADEDDSIAWAARSIGADDFISKRTDAARMRELLCRFLRGRVDPTTTAGQHLPAAAISMTQRQHDVLRLMAQGDPNKRIADLLGIAESTVRAHVSEILNLLGARNRTQAVVMAQRIFLLDRPPRPD